VKHFKNDPFFAYIFLYTQKIYKYINFSLDCLLYINLYIIFIYYLYIIYIYILLYFVNVFVLFIIMKLNIKFQNESIELQC